MAKRQPTTVLLRDGDTLTVHKLNWPATFVQVGAIAAKVNYEMAAVSEDRKFILYNRVK